MLIELATEFSPLIEQVNDCTVVFSLTGLGRLFGNAHEIATAVSQSGARRGIQANLAIAANPSAALLAAQNLRGVTIISPGDEARALAPIPVDNLPADPESLANLQRWGIRTCGELASLPEKELVARLGEAGRRLQRLAAGRAPRLLKVDSPAAEFIAHQLLDQPLEQLEPLLFILSAQFHRLTGQLQQQGLSARTVIVTLELEGGGEFVRTIELPFAMRDPKALLKQVQLALEAESPPCATLAVRLRLLPAEPLIVQGGLFFAGRPEPEKLETLLARLRALVGPQNVGSPQILNSHRPDAYCLRPCAFAAAEAGAADSAARPLLRVAFRYFRPPLSAKVTVQRGRPHNVFTSQLSGVVRQAAGPWRVSGEWWTTTSWDRDEWDIVLEDHSAYRFYVAAERWFVEGSYD